jgi:signal peptidase II
MPKLKRYAVIFVVLIFCVGCDQVTKAVAMRFLPHDGTISLGADTLRLQFVENSGAFLSAGASLSPQTRRLIFTFGVAVFVGALLMYLLFSRSVVNATAIGLSLICGGGIGNLVDRVIYDGYVRDFMNVGIGGLRTGIFNMADVAITVGVILTLMSSFKHIPQNGFQNHRDGHRQIGP